MSQEMGQVQYGVVIQGDETGLTDSMARAVKAVEKLDGTMKKQVAHIQSSMSSLDKTLKTVATAMDRVTASNNKYVNASQQAQKANQSQEQSAVRMEKVLGAAIRQNDNMAASLRKMGAGSESFKKLEQNMDKYLDSLSKAGNDTTKITAAQEQFKNANNQLKNSVQEQIKVNKELGQSVDESAKKKENSAKSMTQIEKAMGAASRQVESLATKYSGLGTDAEKFIQPLSNALDRYGREMKSAAGDSALMVQAQENFKNSVHGVQMEFKRYSDSQKHTAEQSKLYAQDQREAEKATRQMLQAHKEAEGIMKNMEKAMGEASREVEAMSVRLRQFEDGEQYVTQLDDALEAYRMSIVAAAGDTVDTERALQTFKTEVDGVRNQLVGTNKAVVNSSEGFDDMQKQLQNTSKAVQLALGPLSGIAARITALTTLLRTNTFAIAAFVSGITAIVVATSSAIKAGVEYQRQMLGMEAVLASTGYQAEITAAQLNSIAESVALNTLSATNETRQAATVLLTFSNLAVESFEEILTASHGLSSMFGTNLVGATRQLGRTLEDPISNLDALRRVGIQFTDSERNMIRTMQQSGRVGAAQAVIMEKLSAAKELATKETQGLAGVLDTLSERVTVMREQMSRYAETNEVLGEAFQKVIAVVEKFTSDAGNFEAVMKAVSIATRSLAAVIEFLTGKVEAIIALMIGAFVASMLKAIIGMAKWTMAITINTKALFSNTAAATANAGATTLAGNAAAGAAVKATKMALAFKLLPVAVGIGVMTSMYVALKRSSSAAALHEKTLKSLNPESQRMVDIQKDLAKAYELSGEEANKFYEALGRNASSTITEQVNNIQDLMARSETHSLEAVLAGRESVVKYYNDRLDGLLSEPLTATSVEEIESTLRQAADSLGGEVGKEFEEIARQFTTALDSGLRKVVTEAERVRIETDLTKTFGFVPEQMVSGVRSALNSILPDLSNLDDQLFALYSSFGDGEKAVAGIASVLDGEMAIAIKKVTDAQERKIIQDDEAARMIAIIEQEYAEYAATLLELPEAHKKAGKSAVDDFLSPYIRSQKIATAEAEGGSEAIQELMRSFEIQDKVEDAMSSFAGVTTSVSEMMNTAENMRSSLDAAGISVDGLSDHFDEHTGMLKVTGKGAGATREAFRALIQTIMEGTHVMDQGAGSTEDYADTILDFADNFKRAEAMITGGVKALEEMNKTVELERQMKAIADSIIDMSEGALRTLATEFGVTGLEGEALRKKLIEIAQANHEVVTSGNEQLAYFDNLQDSVSNMVRESDNALHAFNALRTGGIEALNREMQRQEIDSAIDSMRESWEGLTDEVSRNQLIEQLQSQVEGVIVTSENFIEVLKMVKKQQLDTAKSTDKLTDAYESMDDALKDVTDQYTMLRRQEELMRRGFSGENAQFLAQERQNAEELAQQLRAIQEESGEVGVQNALAKWRVFHDDLFHDAENFVDDYMELMRREKAHEEFVQNWVEAADKMQAAMMDGFDAIFQNIDGGFSQLADNMRKTFAQMLRDMAYQAALKPIFDGLSMGMAGMMRGAYGAGGGSGGMGDIFSMQNLAGGFNQFASTIAGAGTSFAGGLNNIGLGHVADGMMGTGHRIGNLFGRELSDGMSTTVGTIANAVAGYAGNWAGGKVGESLFGKQANSSWGASIGGIAGTILGAGNPLGAFIGSTIGSMLDVAFGGDGKKRVNLGIVTGREAHARSDYRAQIRAESGLMLSTFTKRVGDDGAEVAQTMLDIFAATDSALLQIYNSLTGFTADLTGAALQGKQAQAGVTGPGGDFFGSAEFNKINQGDLEGAADEFVRAWVKEVNRMSGEALDFEPLFALAHEGEMLADSLIRLNDQFVNTDRLLGFIGQSLHGMSVESIVAADSLVALMGGIDEFVNATSFYYENFFSEAEKLANVTKQVEEVFASLNKEVPETRQEFRNLVDSLDLTTDSGQELFAVMMQIAPAMDQVLGAAVGLIDKSDELKLRILELTDYESYLGEVRRRELATLDETSRSLQNYVWSLEDLGSAFDQMIAAIGNRIGSLEGTFAETDNAMAGFERAVRAQQQNRKKQAEAASKTRNEILSLFGTIESAVRQLRTSVEQTFQSMYQEARTSLRHALTTGQVVDMDALRNAITTSTSGVMSQNNVSRVARDRERMLLANELKAIEKVFGPQLSASEQMIENTERMIASMDHQIAAARSRLNALRDIDDSVKDVGEALEDLDKAIEKEEDARTQIELLREQERQLNESLFQQERMLAETKGMNLSTMSIDEGIKQLETAIQAEKNAREQLDYTNQQIDIATDQFNELRTISQGISSIAGTLGDISSMSHAMRVMNIPQFATGGSHSGGIRMVGERGPEIEATGASRVFSSRQVSDRMFDTSEIVSVLLDILGEVGHVSAGNTRVAKNTSRLLDIERARQQVGMPPVRENN